MKARLVLVLVLLSAAVLFAQTFRGGIQGTVTDSSGASVPDAQVTVVNTDTGLSRPATTDSSGNFFISELPVGNYTVTIMKSGFRTVTQRGLRVEVSSNQRLNVSLIPGEVKESVEVSAEVPLVDTTTNNMGDTIEGAQAASLPVNGHDFTKLLVLVPGSTGDPSGAMDSPGSFGLFSINGSRGRSNNYLLDGTDMNDGYRNLPAINEAGVFGTPATLLPIDALAEVPVISGAEAEYGRNSGAIVNLVTKSGTNTLHGSGFELFRNNALDARNYFNRAPQPQDLLHNNQFGGSLGGPLIKDRTFWFVAYEGQRERVGIPSENAVPTQAMIDGYLASGGVINPISQNILNLGPWTGGRPLPGGTDAFTPATIEQTTNATNRVDSLIVKLDHHFGGQDRHDLLTGRYFFGDSDQSFPLALLGGNVLPGYNTVTPTRVQILSLSLTHVFTPKLLMEVRGGYNRFVESFMPQDHTLDPASLGLVTTTNPRDFGLPFIAVSGVAPIGTNLANPRGRADTNTQYFTNLSYNTGKHNWKFGYEFRRTFVNGFFDAGYRGKLSFADTVDATTGDVTATAFQNFLAGNVDSGRQAVGDSHRLTYQNNHAFYFQDSFQLRRNFTLNYGLRWDYFGVLGEKNHRLSILDPTRGLVQVGGNGQACAQVIGIDCTVGPSSLYPKDYNNFGPRVSFAWDVTGSGKMVVRAGWGVFYDAFSQDFFVGQLPFNTFNAGPAYNGYGTSPILFSFSPTSVLTTGQPVFSADSFAATDVFTVDQRLRTPYVQNYNINIERQIGNSASFQIGYVGSAGRKLFRFRDINQQINPVTAARPLDSLTAPPPSPAGTTFVYVNQFESSAASNYNGLQTSFKTRNLRGLTASADYTWAHSIDNASDGQDYVPNATQPDNSFAPSRERASSNFDTRQRFTWILSYQLPGFGSASKLRQGWQLDSIVTLATGQPFNVNYLFEGDFNGSGEFFGRPDLVGNPFAGTTTPGNYLNLAAFAVPCNYDPSTDTGCSATGPNYHFGNLGRNAFQGPPYRNWDLALSKSTRLGERVNMQFRADFFNILNHTNFANPLMPNFAVDFAQNGLDATGRGIGFLGITATPDVAVGNPYLGGGGPRNIQLALRFSF